MNELPNTTSRRNLLKLGGLGVAGAALLAACGSDDLPPGISGSATPTSGPTPTVPKRQATEAQVEAAQLQLHTLASIELLVADVYDEHAAKIEHAELKPVVTGFAQAHRGAADALRGLTDDGAEDQPNAELQRSMVEPRSTMLTNDRSRLSIFTDLESTLAATYIASVEVLLDGDTRQAIMTHGAACARRVTLLGGDGEGELPTHAVYPPTDLVSGKAILTPEGDGEGAAAGDEGATDSEAGAEAEAEGGNEG